MQILRRKKLFWWGAYLWNAEVPRPGITPLPQQWQHQVPNPLSHQRTPETKKKKFFFKFVFWPRLYVKVPGPGIESPPQQQPEPLRWQCWIFHWLSYKRILTLIIVIVILTFEQVFFFFFFLRSTPLPYGGSHARGWIGAAAAGLPHNHSNTGSELCLQPTP